MVDIQVDAAAFTIHRGVLGMMNPVQKGNVVYDFFLTQTDQLVYRKSENRGLTYGAQVTIYTDATINVVKAVNWYDRWTDGIAGQLVHFFIIGRESPGAGQRIEYLNLNTATDVLSAPVAIGGGTVDSTRNWDESCIALTKALNGDLLAGGWVGGGAGDNWFLRSTDNGLTWTAVGDLTSMATPDFAPGGFVDRIIFMPANRTNQADIYCMYIDQSDRTVSYLTYDAATDVWTETQLALTLTVVDDLYFQMMAAPRHLDGHIMFALCTQINNAAADLVLFDIASATVFTQKTDVWTNQDESGDVAMTIDQNNQDIYVGYLEGGLWQTTVATKYKVSRNGGTTWSPVSLPFSEDADDDLRWVRSDISVKDGSFQLFWHNFDILAVYTNVNNAVQFVPATPAPPLGCFTPVGSAGFLTYITPDGRLYPLHTPHEFGRWVVSFSGFGTPPIQYITQRGPFQHGETVIDFFLRPRVIQLLIRQGFISRNAWWTGRASLLNEIRPNRQLTATGAVPGQLRVVQTDGTVRDLNVFISEGPRFEPRIPTQWDEHAFQEVLRFTAYDPVAFDPAEVTVAFAITVAAHLVFPITFPIQFGSGLIDDIQNVTYLGTWEEFPIITVVGPIKDFRLDNVTTGEKIEFSADIGVGRTVTIDLRPGFKTVVDDLGANLIGIVTSDSDLATWHLAPDPEATNGVNALRLRGNNPTGGTSVTLRYFDRYFGF